MIPIMNPELDCMVAGSCVLDLLCRPVTLDRPIGKGVLHQVEPLKAVAGGITLNAGATMARLGLRVGLLTYVGDDAWGSVLRGICTAEKIDPAGLLTHPTGATSTTVVVIDPAAGGERSFLHCVGAPKLMDKSMILGQLDHLARCRWFLLGYYSLMPQLEPDLPDIFRRIRASGCHTALDAAGSGGTMQPLNRILPHLDLYVPSLNEGKHQTGESDPQRIIDCFRGCGAPGILGVKLGGKDGVLLSPQAGQYMSVPSCTPPGPVVDTTGAGDSFLGGLIAGLCRDLPLDQAGRLGTAAAACCVTSLGGSTGGKDYAATAKIAGL